MRVRSVAAAAFMHGSVAQPDRPSVPASQYGNQKADRDFRCAPGFSEVLIGAQTDLQLY